MTGLAHVGGRSVGGWIGEGRLTALWGEEFPSVRHELLGVCFVTLAAGPPWSGTAGWPSGMPLRADLLGLSGHAREICASSQGCGVRAGNHGCESRAVEDRTECDSVGHGVIRLGEKGSGTSA